MVEQPGQAMSGVEGLNRDALSVAGLSVEGLDCRWVDGVLTLTLTRPRVRNGRSRKVNAPGLVALVRNGALFHKAKLLERPRDITPESSTSPAETTGTEIA